MTVNNKRINASSLDFDDIKNSLKSFLSSQSTFTDYDFEGSNMSMLLNVLAYNTHYRALYDNFILNEMFLDSASKRSSVVSRAKEMGYTPTSIRSASAYIDFSLQNTVNGPELLILPKLTPFVANINGTSYTFITTASHSAMRIGNAYSISGIKITQGSYATNRMNVIAGAKYIIPDTNVDTSTLTVKVQDSSQSNIYQTFTATDGLIGIGSTDKVFWIKEIEGGLYELEFGNGVIGSALTSGNIIHAEYIISNGSVANSAKLFRYIGPQLYSGDVVLTTTAQSTGGTEIESTESVKFNAPRLYSAQNRAVTVEDYQNLIYSLVAEAASVNVWSGANNVPPQYGKVFICIKPKTVEKFTNIEKLTIKNDIIKSKNVVSVIPEIVDPQYIKIEVDATIYYDVNSTTKSANDIKLMVQNAIIDYNSTELQKFKGILRFSKLTRVVDDSESSIVSNVTNIILHRVVEPKYDMIANYTVTLVNPIHLETTGGSILSSGFYTSGSTEIHYIEDDGLGNLVLYTINNSVKQIVNPKIGTIDYGKGSFQINNLLITSIIDSEFDFKIKPSSYDVVSVLDQLVEIPTNMINVNVIADQSLGASGGGANYQFTTSRS